MFAGEINKERQRVLSRGHETQWSSIFLLASKNVTKCMVGINRRPSRNITRGHFLRATAAFVCPYSSSTHPLVAEMSESNQFTLQTPCDPTHLTLKPSTNKICCTGLCKRKTWDLPFPRRHIPNHQVHLWHICLQILSWCMYTYMYMHTELWYKYHHPICLIL